MLGSDAAAEMQRLKCEGQKGLNVESQAGKIRWRGKCMGDLMLEVR